MNEKESIVDNDIVNKKASFEVILKDFSNLMDIKSDSDFGDNSSKSNIVSNDSNNENSCSSVTVIKSPSCANEVDISDSNEKTDNSINDLTANSCEVITCPQNGIEINQKQNIEGTRMDEGCENNCTNIEEEKMVVESENNSTDAGFNSTPCYCFDNFIELAKSTKPFTPQTFLMGCKWSPDGTCLLTNCSDYTMRLFDLPSHLYNKQFWNTNEVVLELQPSLKIKEGGQIYDYDWYPLMSSWVPETCCFLTTSSKAPVHLWDAYTGCIRASYRGYNRADETENALSVKFSLDGDKIYCGYKNEIKIFDVSNPGRDCISIDTKHVAGQCGIISCIAENPTVRNMFAAGSYKKTIGLYLESGDSLCLLDGQRRGITQIMWSHDGICLYSGARKDNEIICWDMRNLGQVLCTMERTVETNQRIYFDITSDGKYLISGNTNGKIVVWDLNQYPDLSEKRKSSFEYQCHLDCANGISVHRQLPIIATTSGQYHNPDITSDDEDNNMFDVKKMLTRIENSIKLWWVGQLHEQEP